MLCRAPALAALAIVILAAAPPLVAAGEARIQVLDGLVSARFDAVPVAEAVAAIRRAAGLEVVLPASVQGKTVTLAADQVPLERFIQRVLDLLDVGGYALVYEPGGQTRRLIVVESARVMPPQAGETAPALAGRLAEPGPGVPRPAARAAQPVGPAPAHVMPLVRVEPTGIRITPRGPYDRVDLTVSGRDRQIRREYPSGTAGYFDLVDEHGKPLGDGSYSYELVVVPAIPEQFRERMEAARESPGDRVKLQAELREQGWLPKEPLIQSGHFSVTGGLIVDGNQPEETRRRR